MTDREWRLMRALTRLAVAVESLERAATDLDATRPDLGDIAARRSRSLRWIAFEVRRELREGGGTTDTTGTTISDRT